MSLSHHEHNEYQDRLFTESIDFFRQAVSDEVEERTAYFVAAAKLRSTDRVLDVGTGTGALIPHIQRFGVKEIVACDLCETMLVEARNKFPGVEFWCGDVMHLPIELGSFDVCFLNAMFGNLWNQSRTLGFLSTRLVTGGRIVISHPLGSAFVAELRQSDPKMVPHTMPDRTCILDMVRDGSLELTRFVDDDELYLCVLTKGRLRHG